MKYSIDGYKHIILVLVRISMVNEHKAMMYKICMHSIRISLTLFSVTYNT